MPVGHRAAVRSRAPIGRQLTLENCFAAYVEFCTQRGWSSQTRNKFARLVARDFRTVQVSDLRAFDKAADSPPVIASRVQKCKNEQIF
jgi:hypothetical protein